ncbi:DUF2878 domain-containing protein [Xylophilus sp. ASV27]|uniref:DUF2878 domain-containing protein n=1 Tax=Xylophilus sp. ASV27 TaxID=2795129 RepID=UPI0018EBF94A|nr:DUF2878 domain-containing protein [Xylophilus sp. ASV27]
MSRARWLVTNVVLSQVGWFAAVLGAAHGWPATGAWLALALIGVHLALAPDTRGELRLVALAMAVGAMWDSALAAAGLIHYTAGQWAAWMAPYWIIVLWGLFATTLNVSLRWLQGRWWLAAVLGALAGPLSFAAGSRLGAAQFTHPVLAPAVLALGWACLMPLLVRCAQQMARRAAKPWPGASVMQEEAHHVV